MSQDPTWDYVLYELTARAYDAYGGHADWKTHDGRPMPRWFDLPEKTRGHWLAAIAEIARPAELHQTTPEPVPEFARGGIINKESDDPRHGH